MGRTRLPLKETAEQTQHCKLNSLIAGEHSNPIYSTSYPHQLYHKLQLTATGGRISNHISRLVKNQSHSRRLRDKSRLKLKIKHRELKGQDQDPELMKFYQNHRESNRAPRDVPRFLTHP